MIHDIRLPERWSRGSAGGPEWMTDAVPLASGDEYREERWIHSLQRYEIAHNLKTPADIAALNAFQRGRRGASKGFLLKDWMDFTSAPDGEEATSAVDQPLGTGDGATTEFQLVKRYPDTIDPYDRPIKWPVAGTLVIAGDGVAIPAGWTVDRGTGVVTFAVAPALDLVLTAGFEFDVPVRFVEDWLSVSYDAAKMRSVGSVQLQEVRN